MIHLIKVGVNIFNILVLFSIIIFVISFYLQIKIEFLSNFIVIITCTTLFLKLLYWYFLRRTIENSNSIKKSNLFLLRLAFCIFTYITPAYYILQQPKLVMSDYVITITLNIIIVLVFIGLIIERYIIFIESNLSEISLYEKNNLK